MQTIIVNFALAAPKKIAYLAYDGVIFIVASAEFLKSDLTFRPLCQGDELAPRSERFGIFKRLAASANRQGDIEGCVSHNCAEQLLLTVRE